MNQPDWLKDFLHKFGKNGDLVMVVPLTFGRARITLSRNGPVMFDVVDDSW